MEDFGDFQDTKQIFVDFFGYFVPLWLKGESKGKCIDGAQQQMQLSLFSSPAPWEQALSFLNGRGHPTTPGSFLGVGELKRVPLGTSTLESTSTL